MKRKVFALFTAAFIAILLTSTVFARSVKFSSIEFSLGSLMANGGIVGLGNEDVKVVLKASGLPDVTCTNYGDNQAPGRNPPKVSASGQQILFDSDSRSKNGWTLFDVETNDPVFVDAVEYGCPNANWTALISFIYWTEATITVEDYYTGEVLASQDFTCHTTLNSVTCTPK